VKADGDRVTVELTEVGGIPDLVARVVELGGKICAVRPASGELERIYLELVREESGAAPELTT